MARNVDVEVHDDAILEIRLSNETRDMLKDIGDEIARRAQVSAPRRTGRGAATIHAETQIVGEDWDAYVSWSWPNAYYLYWHEMGSRQMPPRPFLVPALEAAT